MTGTTTRTGTFRALRHKEFRLLWGGLLLSAIGTWMQIVAQSLLVLKLSHGSALALGFVSLAQAAAFFLFALIGGGIGDRLDRRRLLLTTQSSLMCIAALLAVLTWTNRVTVPIIAALAFLSGVILSFDQPSRAALVSSLVPNEDILSAISLQSAIFNTASIAGPALAGFVIHFTGLAADFLLNSLSFTGVIIALALLSSGPQLPRRRQKLLEQIREALGSVRRDAMLVGSLCVFGTMLFAGPSLQLLLPVLSVHRLHTNALVLGFLFSAAGIGAVAAALFLAARPAPSMKLFRIAIVCWCAAVIATGASATVALTFSALLLLGASQSIVAASTSAFLQTRVPAEQRGRVMSLNTLLMMGVRPLGDFPAGALISVVGAPITVCIGAGIVAAVAALMNRSFSAATSSTCSRPDL